MNPLTIFFGALFWRDIRIVSRKPRTFWARFSFALVLMAMGAIGIWGQIFGTQFGSATQQMEGMQRIAPMLSLFVMWVQFIMLNIAAPTIAAPAFVDERTKRTLDTLAMTPLSSLAIVGSKFSSRLVPILILAIVPVPLLLMLRIFGGLEPRFLIDATLITVSSAALGAAAALCASTLVKRAPNASGFGVIVILIANFFPLLVSALLYFVGLGWTERAAPGFFRWLSVVSPGSAFISASGSITGMGFSTVPTWANVISNIVLATAFLLLAAARVPAMVRAGPLSTTPTSRSSRRAAKAAARATASATTISETDGATPTVADARRRRSSVPRPVGTSRTISDRPVLWREIRQTSFRSPITRWILIAVCVFFIGMMYLQAGVSSQPGAIVPAIMLGLLSLFVAANASTRSIAGEVEARTWSSLLSTPLTPSKIIWSKALGAMRRCLPLLLAFIGHLVVVSLFGAIHPALLLIAPVTLAAGMFMLCCTGVLTSLVSRRSAMAATNNLLLAAVLWVGLPVSTAISIGLLSVNPGKELWFVINVLNVPSTSVIAITTACEAASDSSGRWILRGFVSGFPELLALVSANALVHVLIGLAAMAIARSIFYRHALRST